VSLERLRQLRSAVAVAAIVFWIGVIGLLWLELLVRPAIRLRPRRRVALISRYMKAIFRGIFALLHWGGARFVRRGALPTERPILVVMNHQSLLDIGTVTLLSSGEVPAFVTRRRYAGGIPVISACVRLLGSPVIDPRRAPLGATAVIEEAARREPRSFLIFPEGHRSGDGALLPFKGAGIESVLRGRRMPVYVVVSDGVWTARRFVDFLFKVHTLRGQAEVLGPFPPPEDGTRADFVRQLRQRIAARLAEWREGGLRAAV